MPSWTVQPIATVASSRDQPIDDAWGEVTSTISLVAPYDASSLLGLDEFSHVEVVYLFHRADEAAVTIGARRPRGNPDWPEVGIFAQRGKDRPNHIGICTCELVGVSGASLTVRGLDAIDGTPVLDIKPYLAEFGPRGQVRQPGWAVEIMKRYF